MVWLMSNIDCLGYHHAPRRATLLAGRPKTAICSVSDKIQTAHPRNTLGALDFLASLHLTIFERRAYFDFFSRSGPAGVEVVGDGELFQDAARELGHEGVQGVGSVVEAGTGGA